MTHEEKIRYMRIAASIVGYNFDEKALDMLISLYDLTIAKEGEASMRDVVRVEGEVFKRHEKKPDENG